MRKRSSPTHESIISLPLVSQKPSRAHESIAFLSFVSEKLFCSRKHLLLPSRERDALPHARNALGHLTLNQLQLGDRGDELVAETDGVALGCEEDSVEGVGQKEAPRIITRLSKLSYGMYLMHIFWLHQWSVVSIQTLQLHTAVAIPFIAVCTFVCCALTSELISRLPGSKWIIGA